MKPTPVDLTVIAPGLFGPMDLSGLEGGGTPGLDLLLSRAVGGSTEARDPLESLAAVFGVVPCPGGDLPSASLCLTTDSPQEAAAGCWFHADPVHLRADRDRLLVFAGPALGVTRSEASALTLAFNEHFGDDGLRLHAPGVDRWYLRLARCPVLQTRPLHQVVSRPVEGAMPGGADARGWTKWQNEAEMLFYTHPVNQAREQAGQPTLSGIWTWGGGALPEVREGPGLLVADYPLAMGLASRAGVRSCGLDVLEQPIGEWSRACDGTALVFWDRIWRSTLEAEANAWHEDLRAFENWVQRLLPGLKSGAIRTLVIDDGSTVRLKVARGDLSRFWRRRGGMARWCSQPNSVGVDR